MDPTKPVCYALGFGLMCLDLANYWQASLHGHEPSRGAKVDKELQEDDEKRLEEKGIKK